jgi:hypothetical protein
MRQTKDAKRCYDMMMMMMRDGMGEGIDETGNEGDALSSLLLGEKRKQSSLLLPLASYIPQTGCLSPEADIH